MGAHVFVQEKRKYLLIYTLYLDLTRALYAGHWFWVRTFLSIRTIRLINFFLFPGIM